MAAGRLNPINPHKTFTQERIAKYIRIIQKADPTIRDINVSSSEKEIARQKIDADDFENREIIAKKRLSVLILDMLFIAMARSRMSKFP